MKQRFITSLMTDDWRYKTKIIAGIPGIIETVKDDEYSYQDIMRIVKTAHKTERFSYCWEVNFVDKGQNKQVLLQGTNAEKVTQRTSSTQSIFKWVDFLFDMEMTLF